MGSERLYDPLSGTAGACGAACRFARKSQVVLIGVAEFILASAAFGMAPGAGSLIALRIVKAAGGATVTLPWLSF